jgi:hypothetical protein
MTQQQTRQHSGSPYHINLDSETSAVLSHCRQLHRDHGNNFSNSVIVRRALRAYLGTLVLAVGDTGRSPEGEAISGPGMRQEIIETQRAAKGVL